jgi:carbamoyltransferase
MYILGISCFYHDSSAALIKDGKIIAAAQEERFTRKKHDISFPKNSIEFCLKSNSLDINDIDYIAFYEKPFLKFERLLYQHLQCFPFSLHTFLSNIPSWIKEKLRTIKIIRKTLKYKKSVFYIEHHMAHAAGSFLISPFKKAAILTVDGVGEWTTTAYGTGENNKITLSKEIIFPSSIGLLYSTITAYLGFSVNNSEYKVMGLSPYSNMDKKTNPYYEKLRKVIDIKEDGSYRLDMDYFSFHYKNKMPSKK